MQKYAYIFILLFFAGLQKSALPGELIAKQNTTGSSFIEKTNFNSTQDASNELIVKNDSGKVDQINRIEIWMENDSEISAFQFDLVLPDGFSVVADSSELTGRAGGHRLSIREYAVNTFRFVSWSGSLETYTDTTGSLVQVALQTGQETSPGVYTLQLQNVILSDVAGSNVVSGAQNGQFNLSRETVYDTIFASICNGETYELGTQTLTSSGEYTEIVEASSGADSVVTLNLTVYPVYRDSIEVEICEGETWSLGSQNLTVSGEYKETFSSVNGCDSSVIVSLKVNATYEHFVEASICEGESYWFGSQMLTNSGEYTKTFETVNGCDSVVNLSLTVHPVCETVVTDTIVQGDNLFFGTQILTDSGEYQETFQSVHGCDSIVRLTLTKTIKTTVGLNANPGLSLGQNYPNPFSGATIIPFKLDKYANEVSISVYDGMGRQIKHWQMRDLPSGKYEIEWKGKEQSGVYLYKIYIKNNWHRSYTQTKRMIVK